MGILVRIVQTLSGNVGVDLGRGQAAVTEQLLNASEVGTAVQKVSGEAVPECVRAGGWVETETQQIPFQQPANTPRRKSRAAIVNEDRRFAGSQRGPNREPAAQPGRRHRPDRGEPLAAALAPDQDESLPEVEAGKIQPDQFRDA